MMAASSGALIFLSLFLLSSLRPSLAADVVWYIAPTGSTDIASCGRSADTPCKTLQVVLDGSPQFDNGTETCYLSSGATDGRDSTTLYFTGENSVPPVCLMNWTNVRVVGLGGEMESKAVITGGRFGANRGIFEFVSCTNVSIENLSFGVSQFGRAVLYFEACRDLAVMGSDFPVARNGSIGVQMLHCAGNIALVANLFYGNATDTSDILGLDVTHGCEDCHVPFTKDSYDFSNRSFSLAITDCVFQDIVDRSPPEDSYGQTRSTSVGARLRFNEGSTDNLVTIARTTFQRLFNSESNGVLVSFNGDVENNEVVFDNCTFRENRVRYGGGVSAYFYSGPFRNSLRIQNCFFLNNTADYEGGGVFAALLSALGNNEVVVSNSTFVQNSAITGSGVFILNNPFWFRQRGAFDPALLFPVVVAELRDCVFRSNVANIGDGVVSVLRIHLNISGVSNFTGNTGSAVFLRLSFLSLQGEATFRGNTAISGGALGLYEASKVDMTQVSSAYFVDNRALFQGGAIFADTSSTAHLSAEYNHTLAQMIFGGCFITFGNEKRSISTKNPRRFTFSGNTAFSDGQNIHSFSLRGCVASNFVPMEIADEFFPIPSDGTILQQLGANLDPLQSTSTGPSFLFFYGASTRCYKTVNDVTYLLPNCSHNLLFSTFYLHPDMRCGLLNLTQELSNIYASPGIGLRPTIDKLIAPWAAIETTWMLPTGTWRSLCPESDPSRLVLSPAPGEEFDLTVQMGDQLLNYVFDRVYFVVENDSFPGVLIHFNGLQYGIGERIYFTPNRPLSRVALVGAPGTLGHISVVAASQVVGQDVVLVIPFQLAHCPMGYYRSPVLYNLTRINELISGEFLVTQRTPERKPLACHCFSQYESPVLFSPRVRFLTNRTNECFGGYTVQLSGSLWAGLLPGADQERSFLSQFPPTVPCPYPNASEPDTPILDNLTNTIHYYRQLDPNTVTLEPIDVIPYYGLVGPGGGASVKCFARNVSDVVTFESPAVFSVELCSQGYCSGNFSTTWVLANESFPCAEKRQGPLCGQCQPGYAVTLYSTTCRNCTAKPEHYYSSLVLTLVLGFTLVLVIILFNIGASPTIDTLLFFIQTIYLLLEGRSEYESFKFLAFFNPNFTFDLCITPTLDNLTKLILQYVTPVYILLLMASILLLTCSKRISRYLGHHSILQGLWLLFLITYFNIAMATFDLLYCGWVGPQKGERQYVLVHDASIQCYTGLHLPFAIIAWLLVVLFIVPLPVYLLCVMRAPKLKPIADVYCSQYRDGYRWWIAISLYRRVLLVLGGVFIQDYFSRHSLLLFFIAAILLVTMLTSPYRHQFDNYVSITVTWCLLFVAINSQPGSTLVNTRRVVSQAVLIAVIVLGIGLIVFEIVLKLWKKKTTQDFYDASLKPTLKKLKIAMEDLRKERSSSNEQELEASTASTFIPKSSMVDATTYREPLLDSQFYTPGEADRFGASTWKMGQGSSSTSIQGPGGVEDRPVFRPKRFEGVEESMETTPTTTEVSTGRSSFGVADSNVYTRMT